MAKDIPARRVSKARPTTKSDASATDRETRIARLVAIIDQCNAAKATAETIDEKFLSYMLSMAIQEARTRMRDGGLVEVASDG